MKIAFEKDWICRSTIRHQDVELHTQWQITETEDTTTALDIYKAMRQQQDHLCQRIGGVLTIEKIFAGKMDRVWRVETVESLKI